MQCGTLGLCNKQQGKLEKKIVSSLLKTHFCEKTGQLQSIRLESWEHWEVDLIPDPAQWVGDRAFRLVASLGRLVIAGLG